VRRDVRVGLDGKDARQSGQAIASGAGSVDGFIGAMDLSRGDEDQVFKRIEQEIEATT
jgi:hypothetical protein